VVEQHLMLAFQKLNTLKDFGIPKLATFSGMPAFHIEFALFLQGLHGPGLHMVNADGSLAHPHAVEQHLLQGGNPYTLHPARYTIHPTPLTLHPSPYTLHPTHNTPHPAPCTLHTAPRTLHPTPHTLHPTPYTLHPTP
jgi:hypothetical protein